MDALDAVPAAALNGVGVIALLVGLFWMLAKGHLYTGPSHREHMAAKDREVALKERENDRLWETVDSLTASVQTLTVNSELSAHSFRSIDEKAAEVARHAEDQS